MSDTFTTDPQTDEAADALKRAAEILEPHASEPGFSALQNKIRALIEAPEQEQVAKRLTDLRKAAAETLRSDLRKASMDAQLEYLRSFNPRAAAAWESQAQRH